MRDFPTPVRWLSVLSTTRPHPCISEQPFLIASLSSPLPTATTQPAIQAATLPPSTARSSSIQMPSRVLTTSLPTQSSLPDTGSSSAMKVPTLPVPHISILRRPSSLRMNLVLKLQTDGMFRQVGFFSAASRTTIPRAASTPVSIQAEAGEMLSSAPVTRWQTSTARSTTPEVAPRPSHSV